MAVACNVSWAINDYGIKDMKDLSSIMLAQANDGTTGGGDSTTGGFGLEQSDCVYEISGKANGIAKFTYHNAQTLCTNNGSYVRCKQITCGEFYISLGTPIIED